MPGFEAGPATNGGRISLLEAFLENPDIIADMALGSGLTHQQIHNVIQRIIADLRRMHS